MEQTSSQALSGRNDCRDCVDKLISLAKHKVYIISQNLEADLYNHKSTYDHLVEIATQNRKTDIRLLSHDTRVAAMNGHYLILLAQKLPSFTQVRITGTPEHQKFRESWLIVDDMAYMRLINPAVCEGYFEIDNKLEGRSLTESFLEIWEASQPDQNSRRLSL